MNRRTAEPAPSTDLDPCERAVPRRAVLRSSLGLAAGAAWLGACGTEGGSSTAVAGGGSESLPDGLDAQDFIEHGRQPWTVETKRGELEGLITPTDKVFVRGNLPFPDGALVENPDAWSVAIEGVARPRSLSLPELKALGRTTIAAVLQCSGNGRKFFEHGASGTQWGTGAAANVLWTGVPLRAVIEHLGGAADGARFVTGTGGEPIPEGLEERQVIVERSVPLAKGLEDAILAWELNSEPITLSHGGPLRLIVPGYYGVNNVKYLKRLALTADESDAKIQVSSYRVRPIGEKGGADQPSMWAMNVKSWIEQPLGSTPLAAGAHQVTGVAFSGEAPIASVEVSVDGGANWRPAKLVGPDLGPFAWRTFAFAWDAPVGSHTLTCRARDAAGNTQPKDRVENERGYAHNGWSDPSVRVTVA